MKIQFFCNLVPDKLGMFEKFLAILVRKLRSNGDTLSVVFAGEPSIEVADILRSAGAGWNVIHGWVDSSGNVRQWSFCLPALTILHKEKPDIVAFHFCNELPSVFIIQLSRLFIRKRIKWVWHQQQQIKDPDSFLKKWCSKIRILNFLCNHFVVCYKGGKHSMILRHIPDDKISVIYNGSSPFHSKRSTGWLKENLGIEDSFLITNVSSFIKRKRVDLTITAFSNVVADLSCPLDLHLILVGTGLEEDHIRSLVERSGVSERVHFLGKRDDVCEILNESDILILTSYAEACPFVILEAMSVGLPCLATDAGAARELIVDGESGFVVDINNQESITKGLKKMIKNKESLKDIGKRCKQIWQDKLTMKIMIEKHYNLYKRIMLKEHK